MPRLPNEKLSDPLISQLAAIVKVHPDKEVVIRAQIIMLSMLCHLPSPQISLVTGRSPGTIRNLCTTFQKSQIDCILLKPRGGRHTAGMTSERELKLVRSFAARVRSTGFLNVAALKGAYEHIVGKPCALSTIYRLIERHGLSGKLPGAKRRR